MTNTMIENIRKHCFDILQNGKCKDLPYHNLGHTQEVIDKVYLISNAVGIQPKEAGLIAIAACFHDTGFSKTYDGHEEASKKLAEQYLATTNCSKAEIDRVCYPNPFSLQGICDSENIPYSSLAIFQNRHFSHTSISSQSLA